MSSRPIRTTGESDDRDSFESVIIKQLTAELHRIKAELRREVERRKEAEAAWRETSSRLRCITENMRDIIILTDTEGRPVYISPSAQVLLDYDPHDFLGKNFLKIIHPDDRQLLIDNFRAGIDNSKWEKFEFRCQHREGRYLWFESTGNPYRDENGRIIMVSFCGREITDRKRAEEALRRSEERYLELFENANDMAPEYQSLCPGMIRHRLTCGGATSYEAEVIIKEACLPMEISTRLTYEGENFIAKQGTSGDIGYRREEEPKLKESEPRFRQTTHNMRDLIVHIDTEGNVQYASDSFKHVLGYEPADIVGESVWTRIHTDDLEVAETTIRNGLRTGCWDTIEVRYRHADGRHLWFESVGIAVFDDVGRIVGAILGSRDITDRKEAERKLQEQLEFLQLLIDTIPSPIFYKDVEGRYQSFNRAFIEYVGTDRETLLGKLVQETYPPNLAEIYAEKDNELFNRPGVQCYDTQFRHSDGSIREVTFNKATFIHQGKVAGIVGVISDITALKQAEQALAEEKERLAVTLGSIGEGVITTDSNGYVTLMNRVAEQITGWTHADAVNKTLDQIFQMPGIHDENCSNETLQTLLRSNFTVIVNNQRLVRRDGQEIIVSVSGAPIRDQRGKSIGTVMVVRDVTNALKLEEELLKVSKMESLEVLAGGIAHDFNNLMTVILGNVTLSRMLLDEDNEAQSLLIETEKAVKQARSLTQQLLTFARGGQPVKANIQLGQLIKDTTGFALSGSTVLADIEVPDDLWTVEADSGQISQVLNNLVINAVQAMPDGGTVRVKAENVNLTGDQNIPLSNGRYVRISVADTGIGISKENQKKIFDPYFTTKSTGSGLGLSTAYSIIKGHGGYIEVEALADRGAVFRVLLPASAYSEPETVAEIKETSSRQGKILVMDDDKQILKTAQNMLKLIGYDVVLASDGEEALSIYKAALTAGQRFAAVIMDLTIPGGMGGQETLQHLLKLDPGVKAIVSSGYSNDMLMADYKKWGFRGMVPKPYTIEELNDVLRQVIG